MKDLNPFSLQQWITWLSATLVAGITITFSLISYSHGEFVSRRESEIKDKYISEKLISIDKKIDRLDSKMDKALEKKNEFRTNE